MTRVLIIPAAGMGTRLEAPGPKALALVAGQPMLSRLLDLYRPYVAQALVIAAPAAAAAVQAVVSRSPLPSEVLIQERPTGMLDAVLIAASRVAAVGPGRVWITWCDQVAIMPSTLDELARVETRQPEPALVMPTCTGPAPYIHFARDAEGRITAVAHRREGDAMPAVGESDAGLFSLSATAYLDSLSRYEAVAASGPGTGERNFLPFIPWLALRAPVVTFPCHDQIEGLGINTPEDLRRIEEFLATQSGSMASS